MKKLTKSLKLKILTNKVLPQRKLKEIPKGEHQKEKREREFWYSNPTLLSQSLPKLTFKTGLDLLQKHKASTPEVWSSFLKILLDRKEYLNILKAYKEQEVTLNQSGLTCILTAIANLEVKENLETAKKAFDSVKVKSDQNYGSMLLVYSKLSKSLESNIAVLEILKVLNPNKIDIQICTNALQACKQYSSLKTLEIARSLFYVQQKPDDKLISTFLQILSVDALKNRAEFLTVVKTWYDLEPRHFKTNTSTIPIPLHTWTVLLYFCMKIRYPMLGLSWYESRFTDQPDEMINNAVGVLHKQTQNFQKAFEVTQDDALKIRICVDAVNEGKQEYGKIAREVYQSMGSDKIGMRTCLDMIQLLDREGDSKEIFEILQRHRRELIDGTRDLIEKGIVAGKKLDKEVKLRLKLLRIGKARLDKVEELSVEEDLLRRRVNQVLDLFKS